jgi:hypothetical protein
MEMKMKMKKIEGTDTEPSKRCIIIYLPGKRATKARLCLIELNMYQIGNEHGITCVFSRISSVFSVGDT